MAGVNVVMLTGHVGQDPEVKQLDGGRTLTKFSLATSRTYEDKKTGESKTDTQWHNIEAWDKLAETMGKWVKKGQLLHVRGEIRYGKYEAKDGTTRYVTNIMAKDFQMFGKPEAKGETEAPAAASVKDYKANAPASAPAAPAAQMVSASGADIADDSDDLPF